jgi:LysM repeat protein
MQKFLTRLLLLLILTACGKTSGVTPDLETAVPYHTATPSQTPTLIPALADVVLPTPTIFTYTVATDDILIDIAQRYGVTVEALLAANPGIQPTALSVGTKLVIPTGSEVPGEPTPTPASLPVLQARCWPEMDGGLWCFALVRNDYAETLENLSAQFTLLDSGGRELTSQIAYGLLDILPPGASMPLAAHFAPPAPADAGLRAQVLTAIRLLPGDARYLSVMLENTLVSVEASGRSAQVTGRVILTGTGTANTLWVLATAYDASGNVVGVRRWDSPSALMADVPVSFDFLVSSVGPEIAKVEFLAEARP